LLAGSPFPRDFLSSEFFREFASRWKPDGDLESTVIQSLNVKAQLDLVFADIPVLQSFRHESFKLATKVSLHEKKEVVSLDNH